MKRNNKIIATSLVMAIMLGLFFATKIYSKADNASLTTFDKSTQLFWQVKKGHADGVAGPFSMVNATLKSSDISQQSDNNSISISGDAQNMDSKEIYLVMLSGTQLKEGQATDIKTDILSGFGLNNDYKRNVKDCIKEKVPRNSNLVFAGHSLGGMVSQQLASDSEIKNNYNVLNIVTYGSPLVNPIGREGSLSRLGDIRDIVPYMSLEGTLLLPKQIGDLKKEDGGFGKLDLKNAHCLSYGDDKTWGEYDVLGVKGGDASLSFDASQLVFYPNPLRD